MVMPVMGHPTARSYQEGREDHEQDPQQENQHDAAEGKNIADYNLDVDYVGSEPEVEPVTQDEREVDPHAEYTKMDIPHDWSFHQRMMPWEQYMGT